MIKQTKLKEPQQTNFIGKLENQDHGATMFLIIEKSEETTLNFSQDFVTIIQIMETQNIVNLLNDSKNENSKFATKNWYIIDSEVKANYLPVNEVNFLTINNNGAFINITSENSSSFKCKSNLIGDTVADGANRKKKSVKIVVSLNIYIIFGDR